MFPAQTTLGFEAAVTVGEGITEIEIVLIIAQLLEPVAIKV